MKKFLLISFASVLLFAGCSKRQLIGDIDNFAIGSYLNLVSNDKALLDLNNISNESISIKVRPVGSEIRTINVYAVRGGEELDPADWKLVKTYSVANNSSDITLDVSASELATAFGVPIGDFGPGEQFVLYNETVTSDDRVFNIANSDDDLEGQPAFNSAFRWTGTIICPFDAASTDNVVYEVIQDGWNDFPPGSEVTIMNGPGANQITLVDVFATTVDHKDVIVDIDPATGTATVAKQEYGDYGDGVIWSAEGGGFLFSCTGALDLTITHSSALGALGTKFVLQKK
jgi:hypothetical protein